MHISYTEQAERAIKYAFEEGKGDAASLYRDGASPSGGCGQNTRVFPGRFWAQNGVEEKDVLRLMDELIVPPENVFAGRKPEESPRFRYIFGKQ